MQGREDGQQPPPFPVDLSLMPQVMHVNLSALLSTGECCVFILLASFLANR
jgi:hypothetical protein